jgi:ABC-type sugar transport system permease subunit
MCFIPIVKSSWYTNLDYGLSRLPQHELGHMVGVSGRQRMLTPPRHLLLHLVFPGIRVSLVFTVDYSMYMIWALTLTADFPSTWLDSLILTADCFVHLVWTHRFWLLMFEFEMGLTAGVTSRQGMLTPPNWSYLRYTHRSVFVLFSNWWLRYLYYFSTRHNLKREEISALQTLNKSWRYYHSKGRQRIDCCRR